MPKFFLVLDSSDVGSEHDSWESAKAEKDEIERKCGPQPDALILEYPSKPIVLDEFPYNPGPLEF